MSFPARYSGKYQNETSYERGKRWAETAWRTRFFKGGGTRGSHLEPANWFTTKNIVASCIAQQLYAEKKGLT